MYHQDLRQFAARHGARQHRLFRRWEPSPSTLRPPRRASPRFLQGRLWLNSKFPCWRDNSDDYIAGSWNFSPDAIQEFAFHAQATPIRAAPPRVPWSSPRPALTSGMAKRHLRTLCGVERAFPIDNPAPNPKQPFSRRTMWAHWVATSSDRLWFFTHSNMFTKTPASPCRKRQRDAIQRSRSWHHWTSSDVTC